MGRYAIKRFLAIVIVALFMIIGGCIVHGGGIFIAQNCNDEIEDFKATHGEPEEVDKYDSGYYYSWTFWYWTEGFSMTFTWGTNVGGCKTRKDTFSPIYD